MDDYISDLTFYKELNEDKRNRFVKSISPKYRMIDDVDELFNNKIFNEKFVLQLHDIISHKLKQNDMHYVLKYYERYSPLTDFIVNTINNTVKETESKQESEVFKLMKDDSDDSETEHSDEDIVDSEDSNTYVDDNIYEQDNVNNEEYTKFKGFRPNQEQAIKCSIK